MELEARIAKLESAHAKLRAEHDMLNIAFCSLLAGELSQTLLAKTKESLIATALNTSAPDVAVEGIELAYERISFVLSAGQIL